VECGLELFLVPGGPDASARVGAVDIFVEEEVWAVRFGNRGGVWVGQGVGPSAALVLIWLIEGKGTGMVGGGLGKGLAGLIDRNGWSRGQGCEYRGRCSGGHRGALCGLGRGGAGRGLGRGGWTNGSACAWGFAGDLV
jgi:hypothetical protein